MGYDEGYGAMPGCNIGALTVRRQLPIKYKMACLMKR